MAELVEYIWIYDVNWTARRDGEMACYHAFKHPGTDELAPVEVVSACGRMTTRGYGTKTPGARDCPECLKVTGPDDG